MEPLLQTLLEMLNILWLEEEGGGGLDYGGVGVVQVDLELLQDLLLLLKVIP